MSQEEAKTERCTESESEGNFFHIRRVSNKSVIFPSGAAQRQQRRLQREIDFTKGERNSVVVGPEILQEGKLISPRGRITQDVIFIIVSDLASWGMLCTEARAEAIRLAKFVSYQSRIKRGVEVFAS